MLFFNPIARLAAAFMSQHTIENKKRYLEDSVFDSILTFN